MNAVTGQFGATSTLPHRFTGIERASFTAQNHAVTVQTVQNAQLTAGDFIFRNTGGKATAIPGCTSRSARESAAA